MTIFYNRKLKIIIVNVKITTLKLNIDALERTFSNMNYEDV
jgi:hypothetical protein